MSPVITFATSSAFDRQMKKMETTEQDLAAEVMQAILDAFNSFGTEEAKASLMRMRVKPINKFKHEKPSRMEATFNKDGRIVFVFNKKDKSIDYMYIGTHEVLDKK